MANELIISCEIKNAWDTIWLALSAVGTIMSAIVALLLAFRKHNERITGSYILIPSYSNKPTSLEITLKNAGKTNIDLPDVLRLDFFVGTHHWGTSYTKKRKNDFIPAKFNDYKNSAELPESILRNIIDKDEKCRVFTWTKKGTRIELKKHIIIHGEPYPIYHISKKA